MRMDEIADRVARDRIVAGILIAVLIAAGAFILLVSQK
jgi:hypothetical protein